jgi:hypothetical protein
MKEFEEKWNELQADMITICMEYVEDRADKVFVYASSEEGVTSSSFFYLIHDKLVECHKVNDALEAGEASYNVSSNRMFKVLDVINSDIFSMKELCKEFEKDMPTEIKLIYDVANGKLQGKYKYELVYTHDDIKTARDIADEWFEENKRDLCP